MSVQSEILSSGASVFDITTSTSIFDDFTWGNENANLNAGPFALVPAGNAGGGAAAPGSVVAPILGRWGVFGMGLGTSSNSTSNGVIFSDYALMYAGQASTATLLFAIYTPSTLADGTNDYVMDLGFRTDPFVNAQATNAMCISYSRTLSTNWMAYTSNNSVVTNVTSANSALAVTAGAWWIFKITIVAGLVTFQAAPSGSAFITIGTASTNLPDNSNRSQMHFGIYKTASFALNRIFAIDYAKLDMTFSSAR